MTSGEVTNYIPVFLVGLLMVLLGWNLSLGRAAENESKAEPFTFVQLSDIHWGFQDPIVNPDYKEVLKKVVAGINEMRPPPDFIIFTGDLTQGTDDPQERQARMAGFRELIDKLGVKHIRFLPGEEDVKADGGTSFKEAFGETYYSFDHKGAHVIALDNVTDPAGLIGETQLQWLGGDLKKVDPNTPVIVFTHRPLFELDAPWDWKTADGEKALELLKPFKHVAGFYGHIHQENHSTIGTTDFHAAPSIMYPFPEPGAAAGMTPVPWNPEQPWKGLGFCSVKVNMAVPEVQITQHPIPGAPEIKAVEKSVEEESQAAPEPATEVTPAAEEPVEASQITQ